MNYLLPASSFFICLLATPLVRRLAIQKGWMARPSEHRWHKKPTALLGGIAIFAGVAVPLALVGDFGTLAPHVFREMGRVRLPSFAAAAWSGATLMFILGLLDDFINIKPHTKLVGQILVASGVAFLGFRLNWFESMTLDAVVTIVWIVGIINAVNLIDNMDGLCAGVGLIASLYMALLFHGTDPGPALTALCLAGALAAFLIFNFNPASIFMGDSGSLPIGFLLAMLGLYYSETAGGEALTLVAVPVMVLMVPIMDTTLVSVIRILSGRKASQGGRDHTSHRLVLIGLSERASVLFLYGMGAVSGVAAVFVSRTDTLTSPAVIIPLGLTLLLTGVYLAQLRVYPEKEFSLLRDKSYTPILMELTYKRQILLVIMDFGLIAFAYYLSYRLRFEGDDFEYFFRVFLNSMPAVIACKFIAFFTMGVYRGFWLFLSTSDVLGFIKSSTLATLLSVAAVTFIYRFEDFSKGIFLIDWLLTTGLLLGTRGSFRMFSDAMKRRLLEGETVIIYGAGRGGEILLREILNNSARRIRPVGFIDDDRIKAGKKLQGYPILGGFKDMDDLVKKHRVTGLLISFNSHAPGRLDDVKAFCKANNLFLRQFSIHLKDVDVEAVR